jgi:6-pyruvoyl-tetrahydropterin synthase related domain
VRGQFLFPTKRKPLGKSIAVTRPSSLTKESTRSSLLWAPLLLIAATAFCVEIPFFFWGTPSGHDVEFHLYSWLEVQAHWRHGILYPRWSGLAHFGYGEPRFVFYPPASWMLGGLIARVFPWIIAPSIYIWLALVAAGSSMFVLARRWLDRRQAIFAAVFYAANPYHLVIVYWRSAFAELLAASLLPLLFLLVLKVADGEARAVLPLGFLMAAAWLTNAPAAVMVHYSLALLILFFAWRRRSASILLMGAAAVTIGAALAAFYLVPAIYEQKWVDIAEAVSAGSRPLDNFLFIHTTDADHDAFNKIVSWVAVLEMLGVFVAAISGKIWRDAKRELWTGLGIWAIVCSVLMFPITLALWNTLPKLQFMQFPWRWLLCLSFIFTLAITIGLKQWWTRAVTCALSVLLIVVAWQHVQAPWWDNAADLREMQDNMATGVGYEGTDEYTPAGAQPGGIDKDARYVMVAGPARAAIHVLRWDAESKSFTAGLSAPDQLALKLFPYPAWRVKVNGYLVTASARENTGQMLVPVSAGMNRVEIRFTRTLDRTVGAWISFLSLFGIVGWTLIARRRKR